MTAREFQNDLTNLLNRKFGDVVKIEWDVAKGSRDDFDRSLYCPRLDIAVGPFNIDREVEDDRQRILDAVNLHQRLIEALIFAAETPFLRPGTFRAHLNANPRCFLAIEIEASGSRKHMLGDIANASIMGAIGIIIPTSEKKFEQFKKIDGYISFATQVGKIPPLFKNVIILRQDEIVRILSALRDVRRPVYPG